MNLKHKNGKFNLQYDLVFKKFFADPNNSSPLIQFLEDIYSFDIKQIRLLEVENFVKIEDEEDSIAKIIFDISVELEDGSIVEIELQRQNQEQFKERSLFYLSRTYSGTYNNKIEGPNKYKSLKQCYALNIMSETLFDDNRAVHQFRFKDDETFEDYLSDDGFSVTYLELSKHSLNPRIQAWIDLFNLGEVRESDDRFEENVMVWYGDLNLTRDEIIRAEKRQKAIDDNNAFLADTLEKGIEKGKTEFKEEIKEEVIVSEKISSISKLRKLNLTEAEIIDFIGEDYAYLLNQDSK